MYQTIIFDEVFTAAKYCQEFVCRKYDVETIGEGNNGYGLWTQYADEFWFELDKLMKAGYTLMFIGHEERDKETKQIVPKGDSRSMQPVRDNADVVVYLTSNGIDEKGNVINSSAWFAQTPEFFARSRFDYIDTYLEEYTAENLERVIAEAIERQEKAEGIEAVSYERQKETFESEELDFSALKKEANQIGVRLAKAGYQEEVFNLVKEHLGEEGKVSDLKEKQVDVLSIILDDLKELEGKLIV